MNEEFNKKFPSLKGQEMILKHDAIRNGKCRYFGRCSDIGNKCKKCHNYKEIKLKSYFEVRK